MSDAGPGTGSRQAPGTGRRTLDRPGHGWTVVLRRQPVRLVDGQPEGGYTDAFEIICCYCGDDPDLDYRNIPLKLRRIRGPYPIAAGVAAYKAHAVWHTSSWPCHPRPDGLVLGGKNRCAVRG